MRLYINGSPRFIKSKTVRSAAHFFSRKLFGKDNSSITVEINFVDGLLDEFGIMGDIGYSESKSKPTQFDIRVDKRLSRRHTLSTLAHEMTHAKQFVRGELVDLAEGKVRYNRNHYDMNELDAWEQPWEIEAMGREIGLCNQYAIWRKQNG